jgi:hypothetical protein
MPKSFDDFKSQLQTLKEKQERAKENVEDIEPINPDEIINELITPAKKEEIDEFEDSFDKKAWSLMRKQIDKLLDDFENFYGPKGRGLSVAIHVQKENCADRYADNYPYVPDKLSIVHIVDIGTKGKYEKIDLKKDKQWIEKHNKMVEEQRKSAEIRGKNEM